MISEYDIKFFQSISETLKRENCNKYKLDSKKELSDSIRCDNSDTIKFRYSLEKIVIIFPEGILKGDVNTSDWNISISKAGDTFTSYEQVKYFLEELEVKILLANLRR